jgi:hypothetical protein
MSSARLCERVEESRQWTLRNDAGHHHGIVRLSESPLYLALSWKETADAPVQPVGLFRLDLRGLLAEGYIRYESEEMKGENVRLRVVRRDDHAFCLQVNAKGPALVLDQSS